MLGNYTLSNPPKIIFKSYETCPTLYSIFNGLRDLMIANKKIQEEWNLEINVKVFFIILIDLY